MFIVLPLKFINVYFIAKFLSPEIYGTGSIVLSTIGLIFVFSQIGTNNRILSTDLDFKILINSFNLNLIVSSILLLISVICVFYLKSINIDFKSPLIIIVIATSFGFFFQNISEVPMAILSKEYKNDTIAIIKIISSIFSTSLSIYLAINYKNIYTLILPMLLANILIFMISGLYSKLFLKYNFSSFKKFKINSEDLKFSLNAYISNLNNYVSNNIFNLFGTQKIDLSQLGNFNFSRALSLQMSDLTWGVFRFFFPILKDLSKKNDFALKYYKVISIIFFFSLQFYLMLILFSSLIFKTFFLKYYSFGYACFIILIIPNLFKPISLFVNNILFIYDLKKISNIVAVLRMLFFISSFYLGIIVQNSFFNSIIFLAISEVIIILIYGLICKKVIGNFEIAISFLKNFKRLLPAFFLITVLLLSHLIKVEYNYFQLLVIFVILIFLNLINIDFYKLIFKNFLKK